jgi:hypothetical protein
LRAIIRIQAGNNGSIKPTIIIAHNNVFRELMFDVAPHQKGTSGREFTHDVRLGDDFLLAVAGHGMCETVEEKAFAANMALLVVADRGKRNAIRKRHAWKLLEE